MRDDASLYDHPIDMATAPDYLLVGTVTRDVVSSGFVPGGTVTYSGRTAAALGARVVVVTSVGPDIALDRLLPSVPAVVRPASESTTFENVYRSGFRTQWLRSIAAELTLDLIPLAWRQARISHLAPLVNDVGGDVIDGLRRSELLGLTPQGWLRTWDATGRIRRCPLRYPEETLARFDAVILSEEDVERDWTAIERWAGIAKILVATQGDRGCTVFERGRRWQVPAFPTVEVDATGAGDVFAAAFFLRLLATGSPVESARYANCVASFAVEVVGPNGIPTPADVEQRLEGAAKLPAVAE